MKKLSILLTGLFFSVGFAQISITETSNPVTFSTDGSNAVLVDQPADGNNGIISTNLLDLGGTVYVADDFELDVNSRISKITAYGFNQAGNFMTDATAVSFYIIADEDWYPAGADPSLDALHKFDLNIGDPGLEITIDGTGVALTLDLDALGTDLILNAGTKYWLSVTPAMNNTGGAGELRWNWFESASAAGSGVEGFLLDPADLFASGYTSWTPFSSISGIVWSAQAFTIEGEESMGVSDVNASTLAVYPNPAKDVVNVSLKNADVQSISVTNLSGQTVATSKNTTVSVSALPAGVYVVRVVDTKGAVHTSKVVVK